MTNLPPNSRIDLRDHVLYDKYQRFHTEKSYSNYKKLFERMVKGSISFEEYESLDRSIPDIRGCILLDVINGKSAEKSIDDLCDAFKYYKIDKEDHGYWYKRFGSGHLFSRITFSNLPDYVIGKIVEKCDIKSYLNLRNVSYGLRAIIDQQAPPCTHI
ncbi:hypothetical protein CRE_04990 [Caenorhabditis remanei]|uniref:F-box domain-containing protein n=1 Tax=Caenorhabditis remanei TaxID=31234 RepID=E3MNC5_CAERE|nr:hypothetical protein CRE_04990 [Caenorhabditis remanei]